MGALMARRRTPPAEPHHDAGLVVVDLEQHLSASQPSAFEISMSIACNWDVGQSLLPKAGEPDYLIWIAAWSTPGVLHSPDTDRARLERLMVHLDNMLQELP